MDPIFHISNTLVHNTGIGIGFFGTRNGCGYGSPLRLLRGFGCHFLPNHHSLMQTLEQQPSKLLVVPIISNSANMSCRDWLLRRQSLLRLTPFPWSPRQCATRKPYCVRHLLLFLCIVSCKPDNAQQQQKPLSEWLSCCALRS